MNASASNPPRRVPRRPSGEIELRLLTSDKDVDLQAEGIDLGHSARRRQLADCGAALLAAELDLSSLQPELPAEAARPVAVRPGRLDLIHLEEPVPPAPDLDRLAAGERA